MTTLHLDSPRLVSVDLTNCEALRDLHLPALAPALAALQVPLTGGGRGGLPDGVQVAVKVVECE